MSSRIESPEFLYPFGPSIDGVVIEDEYEQNDKKLSDRLGRYDLLFGVTQAESYFVFSAEDNQYGIETDRRNRLLRTFVRNTYQFHLQEILATIVNEYTDWEKTVLHPINIRDETMEALGDAQYVAPLIKTANLHSEKRRSSYFYAFEYQTKASEYPQVSNVALYFHDVQCSHPLYHLAPMRKHKSSVQITILTTFKPQATRLSTCKMCARRVLVNHFSVPCE